MGTNLFNEKGMGANAAVRPRVENVVIDGDGDVFLDGGSFSWSAELGTVCRRLTLNTGGFYGHRDKRFCKLGKDLN